MYRLATLLARCWLFSLTHRSLCSYLQAGDTLALLLDYDGTLAELTSHPNLTQMSDAMRDSLRNIANSGKAFVAVISGRDVDGVKEKIGLENVIYSGNHGLEVLYPNGTRHNQGIPRDVADNFDKMIDQLNREVRKSWFVLVRCFERCSHSPRFSTGCPPWIVGREQARFDNVPLPGGGTAVCAGDGGPCQGDH